MPTPRSLLATLAVAALLAAMPAQSQAPPDPTYARYAKRLADSPLGRPIVIESSETSSAVAGDVYALLPDAPDAVASSLADAASWCAMMILHPNVAQCRPAAGGSALELGFARKFDGAEADASRATVTLQIERGDGRFSAALSGDEGPVGTHDFRFRLRGTQVEGGKTFIHLSYSCRYGLLARMATQAYLSGSGAGKVGFTFVGQGAGGPEYIGGLRGAVERNVMRYYLAIESWVGARDAPPAERFGRALERWLAAIQDYPRQLREKDPAAYAQVKRGARARQG